MVPSISCVTSESSTVPVLMISERFERFSNTISAPVRVSENRSAASHTASAALRHSSRRLAPRALGRRKPAERILVLPTCSSARRSSGWNTITSAISPQLIRLSRMNCSVRRCAKLATAHTRSRAIMPFASCAVRVLRTRIMASYTRNATTRISTTSARPKLAFSLLMNEYHMVPLLPSCKCVRALRP